VYTPATWLNLTVKLRLQCVLGLMHRSLCTYMAVETTLSRVCNDFVQSSCPFVKIKFKDFSYKGYIRRTKLHQTGTFIRIYKRGGLIQRGPTVQAPAKNGFYAHSRSEKSHLEHPFQYQLVRSQRFRKSNSSTFKDLVCFQGLSRLWKAGKKIQGLSRNFKDPQESS